MIHAPPQIPSCAQGSAQYCADFARLGLWQGLIGLWAPLWGPTGETLHDMSGYGHDGILSNMDPATDWVVTEKGWALDFDGSNDHVAAVGPQKIVAGATQASIAGLANRVASTKTIFGFGTTSGYRFNILHWTDNKVYLQVENGALSFPSVLVTTTGWISYALVYNGSLSGLNRVQLWINGKKQTLSSGGADPVPLLASAANLGNFMIQREGTRFGAAHVMTVYLYDRALTSKDILQLHTDPYTLFRPQRRVPSVIAAIGGPYRAAAGGLWHNGAAAGQTFSTGQTAGQIDGRCG